MDLEWHTFCTCNLVPCLCSYALHVYCPYPVGLSGSWRAEYSLCNDAVYLRTLLYRRSMTRIYWTGGSAIARAFQEV
jgi:hypothetical protein